MLKTTEVANMLHCNQRTVRRYAQDGTLSYVRTPGGHFRFYQQDVLDAWDRANSGPVKKEHSYA